MGRPLAENAVALKARLGPLGLWEAFKERQYEIQRDKGISKGQAWRLAWKEFTPEAVEARLRSVSESVSSSGDADASAVEDGSLVAGSLGDLKDPPQVSVPSGPAPDFLDGECSIREAVEWVFNHLGDERIRPKDAPSFGAWTLFQWAGGTPLSKAEFYKTFASRLMPTRSQIELEARMMDDGRDLTDRIVEIQRIADRDAPRASGSEGSASES